MTRHRPGHGTALALDASNACGRCNGDPPYAVITPFLTEASRVGANPGPSASLSAPPSQRRSRTTSTASPRRLGLHCPTSCTCSLRTRRGVRGQLQAHTGRARPGKEVASSACLLAELVAEHCLAAAARPGCCRSPALRALPSLPRARRDQAPKRGAAAPQLAPPSSGPGCGRGCFAARASLRARHQPDA